MESLPNSIDECHKGMRLLLEMVNSLTKRIESLEVENRELKERLNNNSSNSSLPPSKDFKKKKKQNNRQSSGKKSGGQVGHKGHFRELLSSDQVDFFQRCPLPAYCLCGGKIHSQNDYMRHQVYELPPLKLDVTEYQLKKGCCLDCKRHHIASLPEGVSWGITGVRLTSFMTDLTTKYGLSRREQKEFLAAHFNFNISLGTVFNKQKIANAALETPVSELLEFIKKSPSIHADETSHNRDGKTQWMWGFVSSSAAYFSIHASRGKKVLRSMVSDFKNIIISDRYAAYNVFDSSQRQICWAHLKRDFTKISEKDNKIIARIGKNLLESKSLLFNCWHKFKSGKISRDSLLRETRPMRDRIGELLEQGAYTDSTLKISRTCKNLLENFNALWTFLDIENIEPTNNHAERSLRPLVIWRKKYFCTRSDYGSDFVSRSASINVTCKLQGKSSFEFLCTAIRDYFAGRKTSALVLTG
jgi:transposase